jgi:hypothetical protein
MMKNNKLLILQIIILFYITGVMISPPCRVHFLNPDYHIWVDPLPVKSKKLFTQNMNYSGQGFLEIHLSYENLGSYFSKTLKNSSNFSTPISLANIKTIHLRM